MTPRTLFIIILRVLGIISVKSLIVTCFQTLSNAVMIFSIGPVTSVLPVLLSAICTAGVAVIVSYLLIFKADALVTKFGLHKDISERVLSIKADIRSVLNLAIIVTGAILIISELPELFRLIYLTVFQNKQGYLDAAQTTGP